MQRHQLTYTSKGIQSKKSFCECKQQPNSISTNLKKNPFFHLSPVSLTPVINLYFWISAIFCKNLNWPQWDSQVPGSDSWKRPVVENLVLNSLKLYKRKATNHFTAYCNDCKYNFQTNATTQLFAILWKTVLCCSWWLMVVSKKRTQLFKRVKQSFCQLSNEIYLIILII